MLVSGHPFHWLGAPWVLQGLPCSRWVFATLLAYNMAILLALMIDSFSLPHNQILVPIRWVSSTDCNSVITTSVVAACRVAMNNSFSRQ